MTDQNRYSSLGQNYVNQRLSRLPQFIRTNSQKATIIIFQFLGTTMLSYGACYFQYVPNTPGNLLNPLYPVLVSCALFLAMIWTSKVSGGFLNPSITIAHIFKKDGITAKIGIIYILTQFIAAIFGGLLAWRFFDDVTAPYTNASNMSALSIFNDCLGQIFGTFLFSFLFLMFTTEQTTFVKDRFWINLLIAVMFYISHTFTFRTSVLNPAIGFSLQFWQAIESRSGKLFLYSFILIIPSMIGGIIGSLFFERLYRPLVNEYKQEQKQQ